MSNTQENDKFLTKERKIYLETWIIIAIYLAIALPIHFYVPAFSWHWFTFGLIFLIIPLGLICSKTYFENKMNLTAEQQKKFNQVFGVGLLKLWLADFVYMTAFNHWLIPTYILGVILLIIVFNSLVNAFLGKRDNNSFLNFCLAADLIIGIALTIYLIYIIPDNTGNLQNIITTIVAAIYGGLLTLVGVAWTIRSEREKDRLEEKKKAKPFFTFFTTKSCVQPLYQPLCDEDLKGIRYSHTVQAGIENSNKSVLIFDKIYHDNVCHTFFVNNVVIPSGRILLQFAFNSDPIYIRIKDILGNFYYYKVGIAPHALQQRTDASFLTIISLQEEQENQHLIEKFAEGQHNG